MVEGIARGDVADYQWSALLMAICKVGMTEGETVALTEAMMHSGSIVDLGSIQGPKIDKHSTGGVGDKTSLILAPIAAAAGVLVPMVSGRGLGHTGGTLDKLEAIPGFSVDLDLDQYKSVLKRCGLVLIGQTAEIAPADKFLYALRDATATVESRALITASIMSKKLAEGIDGLVLDVKTGNGAFLQDPAEATLLAQGMCQIGRALGKRMAALVTRMDQPLGCAVGNAVEVAESIACLKGQGPEDLTDLSIELAANMVVLAGLSATLDEARTDLPCGFGKRPGTGAVPPSDRSAGGRSRRGGRTRATASGPAAADSAVTPIGSGPATRGSADWTGDDATGGGARTRRLADRPGCRHHAPSESRRCCRSGRSSVYAAGQ